MPRILCVLLLVGLLAVPARAGGELAPSTRPGDLTMIQSSIRARGLRAARIRSRIARPRPLPAGLGRSLTPALVVAAAAGEVEAGTFVVSVAIINRRASSATTRAARRQHDLEDRVARAAIARLTGVRATIRMRADDLLSTPPPPSFCANLPATLVSALTSPILHLEGAPIAPWTPGQILRNALGLGFRACGLPLPALLLPEEVDRLADDITRPAGVTTTTTLPEECDGVAQLEPQTLTDPAYPDCTDLEWITPIPDCADDVIFDLIDVATGQPIGSVLFGHTTQATSVFGAHPIRLVLHACNGAAGSPGGATITLYPIVTWGG
jgi:hypothetical protein